ncbi:hypothetical protein OHD50_19615 [Escherichia coli]|nr:hypothetical protein [Escherichia coli]
MSQPPKNWQVQRRVNDKELMITAALPGSGDGELSVKRWHSNKQLSPQKLNYKLYWCAKKLTARRAMLLYPQQLSWNWWDDVTVEIRFWLPAGSLQPALSRGTYQHNG